MRRALTPSPRPAVAAKRPSSVSAVAAPAPTSQPRQTAQNPPGAAAAPAWHAWWVVAAGVCASLHVGKLAPAIPALQQALGMTLVQAGFLLSVVQAAGMVLGLVLGAVADALGARRSVLLGLTLLASASALGGWAESVAVLMALRVAEGLGFMCVVLPAPGLLRQLVGPQHLPRVLGVWGSYVPTATALALLLGPLVIAAAGWPAWWWVLAALTAGMALLLGWLWRPRLGVGTGVGTGVSMRGSPGPDLIADQSANRSADHSANHSANPSANPSAKSAPTAAPQPSGVAPAPRFWQRIAQTLSSPGPWLVATTFGLYSAQWLAVVGFLPSIVQSAGWTGLGLGVLTAAVAAVNILGNVTAGRLMQRGVAPTRLLCTGFLVMTVTAIGAFVLWPILPSAVPSVVPSLTATHPQPLLSPLARYVALLLFSGCGGLIPATLFALAVKWAPSPQTLGTTMGWVQQWSCLGQFAGPPLVAWVASTAGGWHLTWVATGACGLLGVGLSLWLARLQAMSEKRS